MSRARNRPVGPIGVFSGLSDILARFCSDEAGSIATLKRGVLEKEKKKGKKRLVK